MIDSHTHLDHAPDPELWIERAKTVGVTKVVSVGCGIESIEATLAIARRHPNFVRVAAGVHPQMAAGFDMSTFERVIELARDPLVVAIGETGFDQYRDYGSLVDQSAVFEAQCELARELDKPLIIHTRAAEEHTIAALDKYASELDVILHCFALAQDEHLACVLERPLWTCSFAGNLTYPSAQDLRDAAERIPLHRILVETDAPYLAPKPKRGKPNEPAYIQHTLQILADVRGISFEQAQEATSANAARVFGLNLASNVTSVD